MSCVDGLEWCWREVVGWNVWFSMDSNWEVFRRTELERMGEEGFDLFEKKNFVKRTNHKTLFKTTQK